MAAPKVAWGQLSCLYYGGLKPRISLPGWFCHLRESARPRWLVLRPDRSLPVTRDTPGVMLCWPKLCFRLAISRSESITQGAIRADLLFFRRT
jgi:hypothetical protein